ncbi:MCE family protein [Actinomadura barringtoniae]|uniref:MCE family protein n=1 Tax=Actinomadura barringtoniae TaxID=1427535 RepID=A0A939P9J1_9ACTN|nr:MCE family protein [Actinomadura barringtoniae]MBO2447977.1 MCE family protein [Actinomadura barringtoniae]
MKLTGQGLKGLGGPLFNSIIFIVVTVLATALLAASITDTQSGDRVSYYAKFTDVAGLHPGHGVRIAGVRVGTVEKIKVTDHRLALVKFSVDRDRDLPRSTTAAVKYLNLVGGRYIALAQGSGAPGQTLRHGGTIPVEQTTGPLNLTQLFQGFQPLMQALSPHDVNTLSESIVKVLQGEGGTVESLLRTVGELTTTLAGRDQVIGQVITNLNTVVGTINDRDAQLVDLVTTLRRLTSGLAADRQPIGEAVVGIGNLANAVADLLQVNRYPIKQSIQQLGRLSTNLNRDEPLVDRFLQRLPDKVTTISRLASYGSWTNFYQCEVTLIGVHYAGDDVDHRPPPTGLPISEDGEKRCRG